MDWLFTNHSPPYLCREDESKRGHGNLFARKVFANNRSPQFEEKLASIL
jgi:hypothetical protein